jgi:hypothetical protein
VSLTGCMGFTVASGVIGVVNSVKTSAEITELKKEVEILKEERNGK